MFNWMIAGYYLRKMPQISAPQPWICDLSHVPSPNVWHLKRAKYPCPHRHVPLLSTHFMEKISVLLECPSHPARERTCPNTPAKIEINLKGVIHGKEPLNWIHEMFLRLSWLVQSSWLRWNTAKVLWFCSNDMSDMSKYFTRIFLVTWTKMELFV